MECLPFRTARLLLRPVTDDDLPRLLAILGDAEVMKFALYGRPLAPEEARDFIDSDFTKQPDDVTHLGVLCRKDDNAVVGFAGLLPCKYFPGDLEIGFVLANESQGKGYATEIGRKLIEVCFGALSRERLLGLCEPHNEKSKKALMRLGMVSMGPDILTPDRGPRSVFSITASR
jgi:[ribosomal protein S5]-alanine N-acetyltransferase